MNVEHLLETIKKSKTLELVEWKDTESRLRLVGRINKSVQRQWKNIMYQLLLLDTEGVVSVDISRMYILTNDKSDVVFAWRVIFQKEDISESYQQIAKIFATTKQIAVPVEEVDSVPLVGRRTPVRGKMGPSGSFAVGPAAVARASSTWQK